MKRLSGWDAVLLYSEAPNVHMHTPKVAVMLAAFSEIRPAAKLSGELTVIETAMAQA